MFIGCSRLVLFFGGSHSLKEKRQLLKSIVDRVKSRFNVSIVELDDHDLWQKSTIGLTCVNQAEYQTRKTIAEVEKFIVDLNKAQVVDIETYVYSPEA